MKVAKQSGWRLMRPLSLALLAVPTVALANADVEKGRPSRSRAHDRPAASTPLRTRRVPSAGISTVHTP